MMRRYDAIHSPEQFKPRAWNLNSWDPRPASTCVTRFEFSHRQPESIFISYASTYRSNSCDGQRTWASNSTGAHNGIIRMHVVYSLHVSSRSSCATCLPPLVAWQHLFLILNFTHSLLSSESPSFRFSALLLPLSILFGHHFRDHFSSLCLSCMYKYSSHE